MRMVFFSSDELEVERLGRELAAVGISCEVRQGIALKGSSPVLPEAELWVKRDEDFHHAFLFCVQANAGFARRRLPEVDPETWHEVLAA